MKILVFGKEAANLDGSLEKSGFEIVKDNPNLVVSYGGDGTLMRAEFEFPGVPKLVLRGSRICKLCANLPNEEMLERIKNGKYRIEEIIKLEVRAKGRTFLGLNDIVVHNGDPRHAIRYEVYVNDRRLGNEIIGDGVVFATPLGSTGYYRSITDGSFEAGIGVAFNNSTEQSDHMVLDDESEIRVKIARGPALVYADNQPEMIDLKEGEEVTVRKSKEVARIVRV